MRRPSHLPWHSFALAALLILSATPAANAQIAKAQKQEAAAGTQPQASRSSWRVMLVISDAVRVYRTSIFLNHVDFGKALAGEVEKLCGQTFASANVVSALPSDPHAYDGIDLVIILEVPRGEIRSGFFNNPMTLVASFVVRNTKGMEIFRVQETANDNAQNLYHGRDRLVEAVSRQFVNDLLSNANVRAALTPAPPVEVKPVLADTALMDSAGLEVPPPSPWPSPVAPAPGTGRP